MKTINGVVTDKISEQLKERRAINIKIPPNEPFADCPLLYGYNFFHYNDITEKLSYKKRKMHPLLRFFAWLAKVATCLIDIFVFKSLSWSTITSLSLEFLENGADLIKNKDIYDKNLTDALEKQHFKIRKRPCKKYRKLKNIFYAYFDNEPKKETYNLILLICELINAKRIVDTAVVIVSKTELNCPPQCLVQLETDEINNRFIYDFSFDLLEYIRNEQYEKAAEAIHELLVNKGISDPIEFEFVMQCLAFCYKYLGASNFTKQFYEIKIHEHLDVAKKNRFITTCGPDANFFDFCYVFLIKYYRNRSAVNSDKLKVIFNNTVENIREALISNNEYFHAARLYAKFATTEAAADNYIIAFLHNEFIKNIVEDECLNLIKYYAQTEPRAKLFIELYDINAEDMPNSNRVAAIINQIDEYDGVSNVLKLCFYYYAVNPLYKSNSYTNDFIDKYFNAYFELDDNEALKCIFGAQILLLYSTIEDLGLHEKYGRSVSVMLKFVLEKCELLRDKKCYVKICRSLNGLQVDKFCTNLDYMIKAEDEAKQFVREKVYYYLNLGATYAFRSNTDLNDYKSAKNTYSKIKNEIKNFPLSIQATYINNLTIFNYLNNPTKDVANDCYSKLNKYFEKSFADKKTTEEQQHIAINILIFAILGGQTEQTVMTLIDITEQLVKSDNYFAFYLAQAKLLYSALYGKAMPDSTIPESVFFVHKKSFFEQKTIILKDVAMKGCTNIDNLNKEIKNELYTFANEPDYEYFIRADLFSLIERWYE